MIEYHVKSLVEVSYGTITMIKVVVPGEDAQEPSEVALPWLGGLRLGLLWLHQWRVAVQRLSWDGRVDAIGLVWSIESVYPLSRILNMRVLVE